MTGNMKSHLDAVYRSGGDQVLLDQVYNEWARDYEKDIWASGNPQKALIVGLVERYVARAEARILDGGCGPGILASILSMIGYSNIVGIDASEGMLEVARAKGCFAELHHMLLAARIDLPHESFDAAIMSGVLSHGHAPPEALDGVLRTVKPGAPIIFTMAEAAYEDSGYRTKVDALSAAGAWQMVEQTAAFRTFPFLEHHTHMHQWIAVYRKA